MSTDLQVPAKETMTADRLVQQAKSDRTAFGRLFDWYYPLVIRYCLRRLFVRALAEDVASDVFLHVARGIRGFPGRTDEAFRRWVYRIATNGVNACLRQSRRRQELLDAAVRSGKLPHATLSGSTSGLQSGLDLSDWPTVYQAILELDERAQSILTLRFFEDLTHDQIAAVLDESPGAVRVALSRALEKLRTRFARNQLKAGFSETRTCEPFKSGPSAE